MRWLAFSGALFVCACASVPERDKTYVGPLSSMTEMARAALECGHFDVRLHQYASNSVPSPPYQLYALETYSLPEEPEEPQACLSAW